MGIYVCPCHRVINRPSSTSHTVPLMVTLPYSIAGIFTIMGVTPSVTTTTSHGLTLTTPPCHRHLPPSLSTIPPMTIISHHPSYGPFLVRRDSINCPRG